MDVLDDNSIILIKNKIKQLTHESLNYNTPYDDIVFLVNHSFYLEKVKLKELYFQCNKKEKEILINERFEDLHKYKIISPTITQSIFFYIKKIFVFLYSLNFLVFLINIPLAVLLLLFSYNDWDSFSFIYFIIFAFSSLTCLISYFFKNRISFTLGVLGDVRLKFH